MNSPMEKKFLAISNIISVAFKLSAYQGIKYYKNDEISILY